MICTDDLFYSKSNHSHSLFFPFCPVNHTLSENVCNQSEFDTYMVIAHFLKVITHMSNENIWKYKEYLDMNDYTINISNWLVSLILNDSSHWYQIQLGYTHRQQVRKIVRRVAKHLKFNIREIACSSTVRDTHGGTIIPRIIANMKRWVLKDTIIINSISHCTLSRWILVLFFLF